MKNETLSDATPPSRVRGVGRPRDVAVHRAILDAAYAILVEDGLSRFSIDAVAAKAGVARTTVYRRWPDKMKLMHESFLSAFAPTLTYADTDAPADDFRALVLSLARTLSGPNGRIAASVVALAQSDPQTQQMFLDDFSKPLRKRSTLVLQAGIDKQEFREDLNIARVLDAFVGAIYLRLLLGQPTGPQWANQLVDTLIEGSRRHGPR
ncbi:TetR/AcrR family transcriptional regulator [Robbsia sp. KACC 23696]|uniref:TetR/AcrR family transcriptional regulator n=1 Tax=Robbsia sp. KACC 23696 TaxID=3149231 RepID=UPI00325B9E8E